MKTVKHLAEFGGTTHFDAFKAAVAFLKKNSGSTLEIPPKTYTLSGGISKKLQSAVMTGKEYSADMFNRGISVTGLKDCEIRGNGAVILADGFMQTLYLRDCKNIVISDLKLGFVRPPYSVGTVISCEDKKDTSSLKIDFGLKFPLNEKSPVKRAFMITEGNETAIKTENLKITSAFGAELEIKHDADYLGAVVCVIHAENLLDTIRIENCKNIALKNVTVFAGSGRAIYAQNTDGLDISTALFIPPIGEQRCLSRQDITLINCKNIKTK